MSRCVEVASWRITWRCNMRCPFCYGPTQMPELNTQQALKLIDRLATNLNTKVVTITGGEPLLRKDLPIVLREMRNRGIRIHLQTNGFIYEAQAKFIEDCVDVLTLPLDGSNADTHNALRVEGSFERVLAILERLASAKSPLVRVGTVASRSSFPQLPEIEALISRFRVEMWKIYQFIPYQDRPNQSDQWKNKLESDESEFVAAVRPLGSTYPPERIIARLRSERDSAYFMINPDGSLVMPSDQADGTIDLGLGTINNGDIKTLLSEWESAIDSQNYKERVNLWRRIVS